MSLNQEKEFSLSDVMDQLLMLKRDLNGLKWLIEKNQASPSTAPAPAPVAVDIDGKYGDPTIKRDPPKWTGDSYEGFNFSQCPPDYLRALAGFLIWQADKDEKKDDEKARKYAIYKRTDAARARAWADRIESRRGGVKAAYIPGFDQDVPF